MAERKRCYFAWVDGHETGLSVVASSIKEAKKIMKPIMEGDYGLEDYTDLRIQWKQGVDVSKFDIGHVFEGEKGLLEGLIIGAYEYISEGQCQKCSNWSELYRSGEPPQALCEDCCDEVDEKIKRSFPREITKKMDSACCWCGTEIKCHVVGEGVEMVVSKPKDESSEKMKILAIEYCPTCDDINLLNELPIQTIEETGSD